MSFLLKKKTKLVVAKISLLRKVRHAAVEKVRALALVGLRNIFPSSSSFEPKGFEWMDPVKTYKKKPK